MKPFNLADALSIAPRDGNAALTSKASNSATAQVKPAEDERLMPGDWRRR
jgi:hypothetical protein